MNFPRDKQYECNLCRRNCHEWKMNIYIYLNWLGWYGSAGRDEGDDGGDNVVLKTISTHFFFFSSLQLPVVYVRDWHSLVLYVCRFLHNFRPTLNSSVGLMACQMIEWKIYYASTIAHRETEENEKKSHQTRFRTEGAHRRAHAVTVQYCADS